MSTYICSDLHGQYDLFVQLLDKISFSEEDKMFVLGDVIDRGPDSIKLLQELMSRPNIICLLGNHELMMMEAFSLGTNGIPDYDDIWLAAQNGGDRTLNQFWRLSEKEKVAVVDSEGIITTEGQGVADITAQTKDGRQKAVIRLKVKKNAVSGWSDSFEGQSGKDALSVWQRSNGDGSM